MSVKFHSYHIRGHCQSFEDDQEEHANKVWWNNNDKYDVVRLIDNYVIKYLIPKFVCMKEYMLKEISC